MVRFHENAVQYIVVPSTDETRLQQLRGSPLIRASQAGICSRKSRLPYILKICIVLCKSFCFLRIRIRCSWPTERSANCFQLSCTELRDLNKIQTNDGYIPAYDASFQAVLSLMAKIEASVRKCIKVIKGFRRTFLPVCSRHASGVDLQSLDFLLLTIVRMVFHRCHSLHVCPRHVRLTVSRSR